LLGREKASALEAAKDIDVDALSLLYRGLAVACHEAGQMDAWAEAEAQADELRDMFLASGKSRRSTPRSELPSAAANPNPNPNPRSELPSARSSEKGGSTPRTARRGSDGGGQW
jgi:hypothetical protein